MGDNPIHLAANTLIPVVFSVVIGNVVVMRPLINLVSAGLALAPVLVARNLPGLTVGMGAFDVLGTAAGQANMPVTILVRFPGLAIIVGSRDLTHDNQVTHLAPHTVLLNTRSRTGGRDFRLDRNPLMSPSINWLSISLRCPTVTAVNLHRAVFAVTKRQHFPLAKAVECLIAYGFLTIHALMPVVLLIIAPSFNKAMLGLALRGAADLTGLGRGTGGVLPGVRNSSRRNDFTFLEHRLADRALHALGPAVLITGSRLAGDGLFSMRRFFRNGATLTLLPVFRVVCVNLPITEAVRFGGLLGTADTLIPVVIPILVQDIVGMRSLAVPDVAAICTHMPVSGYTFLGDPRLAIGMTQFFTSRVLTHRTGRRLGTGRIRKGMAFVTLLFGAAVQTGVPVTICVIGPGFAEVVVLRSIFIYNHNHIAAVRLSMLIAAGIAFENPVAIFSTSRVGIGFCIVTVDLAVGVLVIIHMPQRRNHFLIGRHCITVLTMRTIRQTRLRTGGSIARIRHHAMRGLGNSLDFGLAAAIGTYTLLLTFLGTGRSLSLRPGFGHRVIGLFDRLLLGLAAAISTGHNAQTIRFTSRKSGNSIGRTIFNVKVMVQCGGVRLGLVLAAIVSTVIAHIACLFAGSFFDLLLSIAMPQRRGTRNRVHVLTGCAGIGRITCSLTGRGSHYSGATLAFKVMLRFDGGLLRCITAVALENGIAIRAVGAILVGGSAAVRCLGFRLHIDGVVMLAGGINGFLLSDPSITNRALHTIGQAGSAAGCIIAGNSFFGVGKLLNLNSASNCVTPLAVESPHTRFLTGRFLGDSSFCILGRRTRHHSQGCLRHSELVTIRTLRTIRKACRLTRCRSASNRLRIKVAGSRCNDRLTHGTNLIIGTGRLLTIRCMTSGRDLLRIGSATAQRTGKGLHANRSTSGSSRDLTIVVEVSVLINRDFFTANHIAANLTADHRRTLGNTGCRSHHGIARSVGPSNNFIDLVATDLTQTITSAIRFGSTIGRLRDFQLLTFDIVAESRNAIRLHNAAQFALLRLRASCVNPLVFCGNYLCADYMLAADAVVATHTLSCAGGRSGHLTGGIVAIVIMLRPVGVVFGRGAEVPTTVLTLALIDVGVVSLILSRVGIGAVAVLQLGSSNRDLRILRIASLHQLIRYRLCARSNHGTSTFVTNNTSTTCSRIQSTAGSINRTFDNQLCVHQIGSCTRFDFTRRVHHRNHLANRTGKAPL